MFVGHVVQVVISSPDDTGILRTAIGHTLNDWNSANAERHQIVLVPHDLRTRTAAEDPDRGDVVIAVVDPTHRNTVNVNVIDNLRRAQRAGKLALAWLLAEPPSELGDANDAGPHDVTQRLTDAGIAFRYIGQGDLHAEARLYAALTDNLTDTILSGLTAAFDGTTSARRMTTYRTPVSSVGPRIWGVTVVNHGSSLAIELKVSVEAIDVDGTVVTNGVQRSRQPLSDVFAKMRSARSPRAHHPGVASGAVPPTPVQSFLTTPMEVLAAHTVRDFPRWLRPRQHASALYELNSDLSLRVHIRFEDQAGETWSRTNDETPERVSFSRVLAAQGDTAVLSRTPQPL